MKFAITGASGFIGKYLVAEALNQGYNIAAITRQSKESYITQFLAQHPHTNIDNLDVKECDLNDKSTLTESIKGYDAVVHLAASMTLSIDKEQQRHQTLKTTSHIIDAINDNNIKTLILMSSLSVLNYMDQAPYSSIDEEASLCNQDDAMGDYARMKRDQEKRCQQWQLNTGKQLITVRPGLVYSDEHLSDAHAGFIKKCVGIAAIHKGQVPLIKVKHVAEKIVGLFNQHLDSNESLHLIETPCISQAGYLKKLKKQGKLRLYLPLPWKVYLALTKIARWTLVEVKKQNNIPDSLRTNSVAARQKPFAFSTQKIDNLTR